MAKANIDPVSTLKADHRKVEQLFQRFESAGDDDKREIMHEIKKELAIHTRIEEEIFYRAVKKVDSELIAEAIEEHNLVESILAAMERPGLEQEAYEAKFTSLKESVEHHVEEEEGELFPKVEKMPAVMSLGPRMMERKQALMSQAERRSTRSRSRALASSRASSGSSGSRARAGSRAR